MDKAHQFFCSPVLASKPSTRYPFTHALPELLGGAQVTVTLSFRLLEGVPFVPCGWPGLALGLQLGPRSVVTVPVAKGPVPCFLRQLVIGKMCLQLAALLIQR
jgi:hypothetical protein